MSWTCVHIITRLELGGAQLATLYEVAHSRFGVAPNYLVYGPGGLLDAEARTLPKEQVVCMEAPSLGRSIAPGRDAAAVWQLTRVLQKIRSLHPTRRLLVHTHSSKAGVLGRMAARAAGAECVVHSIHGFGHHPEVMAWPKWRALWGVEYAMAQLTDGFTADSAANIAQGHAEGIIRDQPAQVVRCGIDVNDFERPKRPPAEVRAALSIPEDHALVLQVCCLKPQKDPAAFVRLAVQLRSRFPRTTYLLAGDGELRPALERAIVQGGVQDTVRLLGWRRDVPDLLHACDLVVLTSLWEGLPQVFPQAMAASKPIVATAVDGAPEAVVPGENGFLVAPRDPAALASAVTQLLADANLRRSMGKNGQARAAAFSQEAMVRTLDEFYATLT